jgi:ABC-2 type transport system permease protein
MEGELFVGAIFMSTTLSPQRAIAAPGSDPSPQSSVVAEFFQETLALNKRLFIQLQRRPSTLIAGVIQPLMWLLLFGALFQNAPADLFGERISYGQFLGAGVIVFTAFSGALNAGLPVMFDREFGFLNRLLVAPLASRFSIVAASALYILVLSFIQTAAIIALSAALGSGLPSLAGLAIVGLIILLLVLGVTALSLGLAFSLPGHIELIAAIFITNLPLLFASTALAPLSFMPIWLQWVASLNPLTYAIEPIRHLYLISEWHWSDVVLVSPFGDVTLVGALLILGGFTLASTLLIQPALRRSLL